jgi:hypothetical protein
MKVACLCYTIASLAFSTACADGTLQAQEFQHKTPFDYQINIGGTTPAGKTASAGLYSPSFMIGGVGLPLRKWVTLDMISMDFGFGTTNQTQTIQVSDGTARTTKNYQMLFSSGPRFNLPLGHHSALGLGGGYAGLFQNEYVPDSATNNGVVTVLQRVNCTTCSRNAYQGPYRKRACSGAPTNSLALA